MWNFIKWTSVVAVSVFIVMIFFKGAQIQIDNLRSHIPRFKPIEIGFNPDTGGEFENDPNRVIKIENEWKKLICEAAQDVEICETIVDEAQGLHDTLCDLKESTSEKKEETDLIRKESAELVEYLQGQQANNEPVFYDDVPEPLTDLQIAREIYKYQKRQEKAEETIKDYEQEEQAIQELIDNQEDCLNEGPIELEKAQSELTTIRELSRIQIKRLKLSQGNKDFDYKAAFADADQSLEEARRKLGNNRKTRSEHNIRRETNAKKMTELKSKVEKTSSGIETDGTAELTPVIE